MAAHLTGLQDETSRASETPPPPNSNGNSSTTTAAATAQPSPTPTCFSRGHIFTTGNSEPFIYCHKCDNEIEIWRNLDKSQCCSGQLTITETASYTGYVCLRYQGQMVCE